MSKKTLIFSIVLIIVATYFGFDFLTKDLDGSTAPSIKPHTIAEMATDDVADGWLISSYDELMQRVGHEEGQDWLLMSAIAYHESRFREDVVSNVGAIGLMQIMPIVGRQFNVNREAIADPETNVRLAGKLLRQIEKTLKLHPSTSQSDRISIILACYNGGVGHVADARRLAKSNGEDPNSWEVVARYLKLKADPEIYQSDLVRHGRFTGSRQTIAYVREVMQRYDHYRLVVDHNEALMAQDASRVMRNLKSLAR